MAERINVAISKTAHDKLKEVIKMESKARNIPLVARISYGIELEYLIGKRYEVLKAAEQIDAVIEATEEKMLG